MPTHIMRMNFTVDRITDPDVLADTVKKLSLRGFTEISMRPSDEAGMRVEATQPAAGSLDEEMLAALHVAADLNDLGIEAYVKHIRAVAAERALEG
ncbi:MAG: hypothetical protein EPO13_09750 [Actinomycetota bacterium]|nr:MAG: hypothetical protein EPO13_09750 [Actinomycetota bacterium]